MISWIDKLLILLIAQETATGTSIGASTIALYTLIPLLLIIIAALLVWILMLKKKGIDWYSSKELLL